MRIQRDPDAGVWSADAAPANPADAALDNPADGAAPDSMVPVEQVPDAGAVDAEPPPSDAALAPLADFYVSALQGHDTNPGNAGAPLRTITHALQLASAGDTVLVSPGTYDADHGEDFPIVIPEGVLLLGDEENRGADSSPTLIRGGGWLTQFNTTIEMRAGATLAGFTVTNDHISAVHALRVDADGAELRNNTFRDTSGTGVYFIGGDHHRVHDNDFLSNGHGIVFRPGTGYDVKLEDNRFLFNEIGVEFDTDAGDLGGGLAGSTGGNIIACNTRNDIWTTNYTFFAEGNAWDHVPQTVGYGDGFDIRTGGTVYHVSAGSIATPSCP